MELRHLRHFCAVADALNFRLAAGRLHLTQPALTRSVAALERELGVRLFDRDKRHVALTAEGADLLEQARRILTGADELAFAAYSLSAKSSPVLRVGVFGNGLAELTHPVLQAFCDRYPNTRVQVIDADFARSIAPLFTGEYHVALLRAPVGLPQLRQTAIFVEPRNLLLWPGHRHAERRECDVEEFFDEPWVALHPAIPGPWGSYSLCTDRRGDTAASIGAYARSESEYSAAVAYRRLVGLAPASAGRMHPQPLVRAVEARGAGPSVAAVAHPAVGYEPAAAAFAEVASEVARRHLSLVPLAGEPHSA